MFSRAFGASDFTRFWQYWNPLGGYFLGYFCYAPLRRFAPRPLCLIVTFALNGLLHDLGLLWPFGLARTERLPIPFPVANYGPAFLGVDYPLFLASTAVAYVPILMVYSYFAATIVRVGESERHAILGKLALSILLLLLLTFLPACIGRWKRRRQGKAS